MNTGVAVGEGGTIFKTLLSVNLPEISHASFPVYSNPAINGFTIHADLQLMSSARLYIYNMEGKQIEEEIFAPQSHYIDIRNLENGGYLVDRRWREGSAHQRSIVNR